MILYLAAMELPTQQQCLNYFKEYKVPKNILQHCLKVQQVAVFLAKKLAQSGVTINVELVRAGSVLHDLFKIAGIKNPEPSKHHQVTFSEEELAMRQELRRKFPGKHETQIAYEIFKEQFPELALLLLHEGDVSYPNKTVEEALIAYVDCRIFKEQVVSLEERFAYFAEVYAVKSPLWETARELARETEREIFSSVGLEPHQLKDVVEAEPSGESLTTVSTDG